MSSWRTSNVFSEKEIAAFELAEAMSRTPVTVSESIFTELKIHFKDSEIVELAATIAMENYRARFNRAFSIEAQGLYEPKS